MRKQANKGEPTVNELEAAAKYMTQTVKRIKKLEAYDEYVASEVRRQASIAIAAVHAALKMLEEVQQEALEG